MKVKLILPALTEATSPHFRPIKYSLFPPLGLAALAGHLDPDDDVEIVDEHVMPLHTHDEPDLIGIEVYITSARAPGCDRSSSASSHSTRRTSSSPTSARTSGRTTRGRSIASMISA